MRIDKFYFEVRADSMSKNAIYYRLIRDFASEDVGAFGANSFFLLSVLSSFNRVRRLISDVSWNLIGLNGELMQVRARAITNKLSHFHIYTGLANFHIIYVGLPPPPPFFFLGGGGGGGGGG